MSSRLGEEINDVFVNEYRLGLTPKKSIFQNFSHFSLCVQSLIAFVEKNVKPVKKVSIRSFRMLLLRDKKQFVNNKCIKLTQKSTKNRNYQVFVVFNAISVQLPKNFMNSKFQNVQT